MQSKATTPKQYLAELADDQREIIDRIRKAIRKVAPKAKESMQYGMLDYPGLANLGVQKRYVSVYVVPKVLARHRKFFPGVDAGKSCLRFTRLDQVDPDAVVGLLKDVRDYRREAARKG